MASKVKIVYRLAAYRELRTLPGIGDLDARADRIAAAAGEGVEVLPVQTPRNRSRRLIATVTPEAAIRNSRDNTLIRALDAGR